MKLNQYLFLLVFQCGGMLFAADFGQDLNTVSLEKFSTATLKPMPTGKNENSPALPQVSLSDKDLNKRLFTLGAKELQLLPNLRALWKQYAKEGGNDILLKIENCKKELTLLHQEQDKLKAIQLYQRNSPLLSQRNSPLIPNSRLSSEQLQALDDQKDAYENAEYFALALSRVLDRDGHHYMKDKKPEPITDDPDFEPLCDELKGLIQDSNLKSIAAARRFDRLQQQSPN